MVAGARTANRNPVRPQAEVGEVVVVFIKDRAETRIARWYPEGGRVRLQPIDVTKLPIYELQSNVEVRARVHAVIRGF